MPSHRDLAQHLRKEFPEYRVHLIWHPSGKVYGDCWKRKNGIFRIRLDPKLSKCALIMVLIHEWAHVLSWDTDTHPSEHGPKFGLAYSRVWQSYLRWVHDTGQ